MDLKEIRIWNIKFNLLTPSEIGSIVLQWLNEDKRGIHLTGANLETVAMAQEDELLKKAIMDSDIVNVDSMMPARYIRKMGYDIKGRAASPDVMEELLKIANTNKQKVFFLGSKQDTLDKLKDVLDKEYPDLRIIGMQNGYYSVEKECELVDLISSTAPDYLYIALPSPRKEQFILNYKHSINAGVLYGIGGALDAKAGVLKRPPKWLQGHGLEAVFRLIRRPRVFLKRWLSVFKFLKIVKTWKNTE